MRNHSRIEPYRDMEEDDEPVKVSDKEVIKKES